jgi:hypothetical protein
MKNSKVSKEQALKALLLVALVGSLSGLSVEEAFKAVDLSSEIMLGQPTGAPPVQTSGPLSMSPNALSLQDSKTPKIQVGSVPIIARGSAAKKSTTPLSPAPTGGAKPADAAAKSAVYTGKINVCDVALHLSFAELIENGQHKTVVTVKEAVESENAADNMALQIKVLGSLIDNGVVSSSPNASAKAEVDRAITLAAEKKLAEMGRCEDKNAPVTKEPPSERRGDREVVENERASRPSRRSDRGGAGGTERVRGAIKKISLLGDIGDDNEARGRARAERELERLVKSDIYPTLKGLLLRRDSAGEAQEMIDEAIEEVESAGRDAGMNNSRIQRLVGSLRGLKAGAETYSRSIEMAEEVKALRKDIADARTQYGGQIPSDYYQQMQELNNRMQQEITMNAYQQMSQYRAYMNAAEVQQFTQPYQNLQRELQSLVSGGQQMPGMNGLPGSPGNTFGAGLNGGMNGMNGMNGGMNNFGQPMLGQPNQFIQPNGMQNPFMQNQNLMLNRPFMGQQQMPMPMPMNQGMNPMFMPQQQPMFNQGMMQPSPFMQQQPMLAQGNYGYGNPAPFMGNQSSVFMNQGYAPQYYNSALPGQSMLAPQVGAYANFQISSAPPSIFSAPAPGMLNQPRPMLPGQPITGFR